MWTGFGLAVSGVVSLRFGVSLAPILPTAVSWAFAGFLAGSTFAGLLAVAERENTVDRLSFLRVGVLGAMGAALASFLALVLLGLVPLLGLDLAIAQAVKAGLLGALSATATVKLAQSVSDVGVTHELLRA